MSRPPRNEPQPTADILPRLLTRRMAAHYLSISTAMLDSLRLRGEIEVVGMPGRDGRPIRVPLYDVRALDAAVTRWTNGGGR